jgi:hypothetical protein
MKIFISWSGETSRLVAAALRDWLPDVIQAAEPFMSAVDVTGGEVWDYRVAKELADCTVGIVCLTPENLTATAILYEVGVLSHKLGTCLVCPYLFQVSESSLKWPLGRLQAKRSDKQGTRALVHMINRAMKANALPSDRLDRSFEQWWPQLEAGLGAILKPDESAQWFDKICLCSSGPIAVIASAVENKSEELRPHFEYSTGSGQFYALSELLPVLTKTYPNQKLDTCFASHIEQDELHEYNLVLLGGRPTNRHTDSIMPVIQERYSPPFEYEGQRIASFPELGPDEEFKPLHLESRLVRDFGLIIRAWNPFAKGVRRRFICLLGTTTFGTEAAAKILCDRDQAEELSRFPCSVTLVSTSVEARLSRCTKERIVQTVELTPK